jgi:GNAT superfamily N-acetyltransferase
VIRRATPDDVVTLLALERAASTAAFAHIFGDLPFPDEDVLARWQFVVDDPAATVVLDDEDGVPIGYAAYGDGWLRHLGYLPSWWGTGRARFLHDTAIEALRADSPGQPLRLWVLVENRRARRFYAGLGWLDSGLRDTEVFAPYPEKMQLALPAEPDR